MSVREEPDAGMEEEEDGLDEEEQLLSTGMLDIRLERLIKRVVVTPLQREFLAKAEVRAPKNIPTKELVRVVMRKVYGMNIAEKTQLLKEAIFCKLRADREKVKWYTSKLSGEAIVTSPRGRRKIGLHIEHKLENTVEASVDRFEEGVWVVLFNRSQLQRLAQSRQMTTLSSTAFVWFPGEHALYCNRAKPAGRLIQAVCSGLGFAEAQPYRLSGRRLSSMRLMFTAKASRRFYETSIPADQYPLPM